MGHIRLNYDRPKSIGRVRAFLGNFGMAVRALAYMLANGPEGLRQTTEDAVLNANYVRTQLRDSYDLPYDQPCMHECVFSDRRQAEKGVRTMDIAKRLIDYGFHPYTTAFPLIVPGALMIEPTESASKEELDAFIDALQADRRRGGKRSGIRAEGPLHHPRHPPRRSRRRAQAHPALEARAGTWASMKGAQCTRRHILDTMSAEILDWSGLTKGPDIKPAVAVKLGSYCARGT